MSRKLKTSKKTPVNLKVEMKNVYRITSSPWSIIPGIETLEDVITRLADRIDILEKRNQQLQSFLDIELYKETINDNDSLEIYRKKSFF